MHRLIPALLVFAGVLGLVYAEDKKKPERTAEEKKAIAEIRKLNGLVLELAQNDPRLDVSYLQKAEKFSDAYLTPLKSLSGVVHLNLRGQPVTDEQLAHLKNVTSLTRLHLEKTKITNKGMAHLKGLVSLEYLNIYGTAVGDKGLEHLTGMKKLKNLYVWQTKVTDAGVAKLKKALPKLKVERGLDLAPPKKPEEKKKPMPKKKKPAPKKKPATKTLDGLPLVFADDFEKGATHWQPTDAKAWRIATTKQGKVYNQFGKSKYKPPHRSPLNISLVKEARVGDFVLTVKVQSTGRDVPHRDMCLFFGYQDPAHFYYVHLGKQADPHANQIFIVNDKPRTKISTKTTPGTKWDDKWHNVKIVRKVKTGVIEIYFDDMNKPAMTASDKTFAWGGVGLGSFDDSGNWDDFKLYGTKTAKK